VDSRVSSVPLTQRTHNPKLRRIVQTIADITGKPWPQLRIADLGSHEGVYAIEFASHGAQVLAIDGRATNLAVLEKRAADRGLSTIETVTDDLRNFSVERYGLCDVVNCAGVLYHLPAKEGCGLIQSVADTCARLAIIDTHVGQRPDVSVTFKGHTYHGDLYREFPEGINEETKRSAEFAALDNNVSFWITYPSLLNLLKDVGFTSVHEMKRPHRGASYSDRAELIAIKGVPQSVATYPAMNGLPDEDLPEGFSEPAYPRDSPQPKPRWRVIGGAIKRKLKSR